MTARVLIYWRVTETERSGLKKSKLFGVSGKDTAFCTPFCSPLNCPVEHRGSPGLVTFASSAKSPLQSFQRLKRHLKPRPSYWPWKTISKWCVCGGFHPELLRFVAINGRRYAGITWYNIASQYRSIYSKGYLRWAMKRKTRKTVEKQICKGWLGCGGPLWFFSWDVENSEGSSIFVGWVTQSDAWSLKHRCFSAFFPDVSGNSSWNFTWESLDDAAAIKKRVCVKIGYLSRAHALIFHLDSFPPWQVAINWGSPIFGTDRRFFFGKPPCLDAAAESAFQGSILHRKLLGRLSRRCYLGDWGNHPAPAMTKRVPKLGARVLTCVDPLVNLVWLRFLEVFLFVVGICCCQFLSCRGSLFAKSMGRWTSTTSTTLVQWKPG